LATGAGSLFPVKMLMVFNGACKKQQPVFTIPYGNNIVEKPKKNNIYLHRLIKEYL
jgi:hypothetical protein